MHNILYMYLRRISLHDRAHERDNDSEIADRRCWDALRFSGERLNAASAAVTSLACVTPAGCRVDRRALRARCQGCFAWLHDATRLAQKALRRSQM